MPGFRTILNAIREPRRYARIASARLQMKSEVPLHMRSAFQLQTQMDIHPRSAWHSPEFIRAAGETVLATGGRIVVIGLQSGTKAELNVGQMLGKRATLRPRPLAAAAEAHWIIEASTHVGKVLLTVASGLDAG